MSAKTHEAVWQPIETAPKDGTHFLGYGAPAYSSPGIAETYADEDYLGELYWVLFIRNDAETDCWEPTHWMPLPEPPSVTEE